MSMSSRTQDNPRTSTSKLCLQIDDVALNQSDDDEDLTPHGSETVNAHNTNIQNEGPQSPERPVLNGRSFTSPVASSFWRWSSQNSYIHDHSHGSSSHTDRGGKSPRREWSVFKQTMKNGGQLNPPRSVRLRRSFVSNDGGTDQSPILASSPALHASLRSLVQSPVQESSSPLMTDRSPVIKNIVDDPPDYDSDDSNEDSDPTSENDHTVQPKPPKRWSLTSLQRNIIKCATAYFIGSLFTYVPALSRLLSDITSAGSGYQRPSPSAHMVATVAVYYNPAKTVGAMLEADFFCLLGLAWASFICIGSMSMFWWLDVQPGWEWLADVLVLLWVGLGMTAVAFMKMWMNKPSFNTACSMTAIILFVVIIREGGVDTLLQVACIVAIGALISNLICHILWPESAASKLRDNMSETLDSFSTLLSMLTNTFLLEDSSSLHQPSQGRLQRAVDSHQRSFTSLKKNLEEAKSEWILDIFSSSRSKKIEALEDAVDSLNRLAQHLNGLRSGTRLQYELTKAHRDGKIELRHASVDLRKQNTLSRNLEEEDSQKGKDTPAKHSQITSDENATLQAAARIFGDLVEELGPPLSALSSACTDTFRRLREIFSQRQDKRSIISNHYQLQEFFELADEIERALFTFESTANYAIMRVYRRSANNSAAMSYTSLASEFFDNENDLLTHNEDHETVFLVYFFIFTLQEFAHELVSLVDALGRVHAVESAVAVQGPRWRRWASPVWKVLRRGTRRTEEHARRREQRPQTLGRRISTLMSTKIRLQAAKFPKIQPHAPNTIQTPSRSKLSFFGRIQQSIWSLRAVFKQRNVKYAIKAGMATAMLAAPGFIDATRPVFVEYRGEWALISFFVVISPTIGATNFLSLHRILGTLLGAITAVTVFILFDRNPIALSIFGFFFSMPCFYYIVSKPQYATSGRFVLLTYNLTCLFCYNVRHSDVSVNTVAFHRSTAVTVGVVWAGLVSRFWWPSEARRELSNALSEFCLNIGWLYTSLVAANFKERSSKRQTENRNHEPVIHISDSATVLNDGGGREEHPNEMSNLLPKSISAGVDDTVRNFVAMELHLQVKIIELQGLLAQTQHEPRLKGPFPVKLYRSILTSLQTILDKLHSMRCVTTREEWFTNVRQDFVLPVIKEQREMVGNVVLYFSVLSAAFKLKAPLPPYLPPAETSRQRLVQKIRRLEIVRSRSVKGSKHLLFFAYALTMKSVIQELDFLGKTLQEAFGVIGGEGQMGDDEDDESWQLAV